MFLTEQFGFFSLSALSAWGFLMAFFFNVFVYSLDVKRRTTLLLSSFIMMLSYMAGDYFFTWISSTAATYFDWVLYDLATVFALLTGYYFIKKTTPSFLYLVVGLAVNITLFISLYIDVELNRNSTPWLLWDIYAFGVNFVDYSMIAVLIIDRDIYGLHKLKKSIKSNFRNKKVVNTSNVS